MAKQQRRELLTVADESRIRECDRPLDRRCAQLGEGGRKVGAVHLRNDQLDVERLCGPLGALQMVLAHRVGRIPKDADARRAGHDLLEE